MHRVNLDCLEHSCKGHFMKNTNISLSLFDQEAKNNYQTLLLIQCLFLLCCYTSYKYQIFNLAFHAHIAFAHLHMPVW